MKELLEKLSTYNVFNYLLPGAVFAFTAEKLTSFSFIIDDFVLALFVYYFFGLIISRIGSIFLEPVLKKIKFIQFAPYPDYIRASKVDGKIELLSEANNMYRTFCSVFLCLLLLRVYEALIAKFEGLGTGTTTGVIVVLLIIFIFSYRKQTSYVVARISQVTKSEGSAEVKLTGE